MRFRFSVHWQLQSADQLVDLPEALLNLLNEISRGENLRQAAEAIGVSYRTAWGLIGRWEEIFSTPLVSSQRGRGTSLTSFAAALLELKNELDRRFTEPLALESESCSGYLTRMSTGESSALRVVSSDHGAINQLAMSLRKTPKRRVVVEIIGSESALRRYQRPDADIAGFHIPLGQNFTDLARRLINLLDTNRDEIYLLERRELGLVYNSDLVIQGLGALLQDPKPRFINRQPGSATRLSFDSLLHDLNIVPNEISGYADEEHTHMAVAARIASGERDVGFAERRAAEKFSLAFTPFVSEYFYISWKKELQEEIKNEMLAALSTESGLASEKIALHKMRSLHGVER